MSTPGRLILILSGGQEQEFTLAAASATLGRATTNEIVLRDPKVSRSHARVEAGETGYTLVDLDSVNGTQVNGVRVERALLAPGDVIKLGDTLLRYETALPRSQPQVARLENLADLDLTLSQATIPMTLSDTRAPRLAVHAANKTWELPLTADSLTIGRDPGSDIPLMTPKFLDTTLASKSAARPLSYAISAAATARA